MLVHASLVLAAFLGSAAGSREEEVIIETRGGLHLAGTLTLPAGSRPPFPAAVSLTGSGPHYRDGNRSTNHPYRPFREIAGALASRGVAMLRLDDRGVGGSGGDANAATGDDVADDARAALEWLRARKDIDPSRIAVIGHSFGGIVAPMVAAGDSRVKALVLMGAPAVTFRETMRYQHRYDIGRDETIKPERRAAALEERMARQERNVTASVEKWRQWAQDRDPLPTARRVRCPALILQGTTDRAVSVDDARTLERVMRESGNSRVALRVFDNLNHHFNVDPIGATDAYDRLPTQTLAPEFLDALSDWLARTLGNAGEGR